MPHSISAIDIDISSSFSFLRLVSFRLLINEHVLHLKAFLVPLLSVRTLLTADVTQNMDWIKIKTSVTGHPTDDYTNVYKYVVKY